VLDRALTAATLKTPMTIETIPAARMALQNAKSKAFWFDAGLSKLPRTEKPRTIMATPKATNPDEVLSNGQSFEKYSFRIGNSEMIRNTVTVGEWGTLKSRPRRTYPLSRIWWYG
jgi:hypothetical protein